MDLCRLKPDTKHQIKVAGVGCGGAALFESKWVQQKTGTEVVGQKTTTVGQKTVANVYVLPFRHRGAGHAGVGTARTLRCVGPCGTMPAQHPG